MTASDQGICATCGRSFVRKGGRGRPQRYCGTVCRRAAEYELARVQGLVRRAQQRCQDAALAVAVSNHYRRADDEKTLHFWTEEVDRQRAELRRLLEASESSAPEFPQSA